MKFGHEQFTPFALPTLSLQNVWQYTGPESVMVGASTLEAGGRGFDPGPHHTKDVKNAKIPVATLLGTQHYEPEAIKHWLLYSKNSCRYDNLNDRNTVNMLGDGWWWALKTIEVLSFGSGDGNTLTQGENEVCR